MTGPREGYVEGGRLTRLFFRAAHRLGRGLKRPRPLPRDVARVVVVKLGGVGDAVLATPLLEPLRARYPGARVDVLCWSSGAGVFRGNPAVGEVFTSALLDADGLGRLARALRPGALGRLGAFLRGADVVVFLNRICTVGGFLKLLLIARLARGAVAVGLDTGGRRGTFLDLAVADPGYLVQHEVAYVRDILAALGAEVPLDRLKVAIPVAEADRRCVDLLLEPLGGRPFVALHIGSSQEGWRALKRLPLEVWLDLGRRIVSAYGTSLVLLGSREDLGINAQFLARAEAAGIRDVPLLDLGGRTSLPQLVEIVSRARLFLGTDSGVAHAAAAAGTPLVTAFLFSDFVGFAPWGERARVAVRPLPCGPCLYWKGYASCQTLECSHLGAEELFREAAAALETAGFPSGEPAPRGQQDPSSSRSGPGRP